MDTLLIARILIALIGTGAATYYDIFNRKNVPDRLLYAFLAVALLVNVLDYSQFLARLPLAALIIGVLYLMYRFGQLGGADLIVLAAIYAALPAMTSPLLSAPQPILQILQLPSLIVVLAISAVLCALWLIVKLGPRLISDTLKGKAKIKPINAAIAVLMLVAYSILIYMMLQLSYILPIPIEHILFLTVIVVFVFIFSIYKETIMGYMLVWKRRVEPEEVILLEALPLALVKRLRLERLVTYQQLKRMNRLKRKWPVMDLPAFLPFILAGLVIYILVGG